MPKALVEGLRHLLVALFAAFPELVALLRRVVRLFLRRREGGEGTPIDCLPVPPAIYLRPDASLYSQGYLMGLGMAVTWDNPDIVLTDATGTVVPSHDLAPATEYTVAATIHNRSNDAPAMAMPVVFSLIEFGVGGATVQTVGTDVIDLPVRGAPGEPALATTTWTTPTAPGHYCLQVEAVCLDDANPLDNIGQENTVVGAAQPGERMQFAIPVRNPRQATRRFDLRVDGYVLPERPLLVGEGAERRERKLLLERVVEANARDAFPTPSGWAIALSHELIELESDGATEVMLSVEVPPTATAGARHAFNVVVAEAGTTDPVGGVTVVLGVT
jgi:hypothetical protein